jgi:SAM-dependent methyltransferase
LIGYYQSGYHEGSGQSKGYPDYASDERFIRKNFQKKLRYLEKLRAPGSILDVGAAYGYFLDEARNRGWDVHGIDVSTHAAAVAREKLDLKIEVDDFLEHDYKDRLFDVITMFDAIEHMEEPIRILKKSFDLLKPGGILFVGTGDNDCLWARILGKNWYFYNPPQHVVVFSAATLCSILRNCGFVDTKTKVFGRTISVNNALFKLSRLSSWKIVRVTASAIREKVSLNIGMYLRFGDDLGVAAIKGAPE